MPFQRRESCIFHWCRLAWLTIWDKVKSHGTVRLMHRKRVTCELHDSYFCSMTIKHAIPRTAEVTHPDGQLWGGIEWAIEILYNSVRTGSQLVWRPDPLVTRCGRGSLHPAEWAPKTSGWAAQESGKETLMAIRVGVPMLQICSVSNSLSHTTFQIKREVYIFLKDCVARLYYCVVMMLSAWIYTWVYNMYTYPTPPHKQGVT